jgi:TonB family protein
VKITRPVAARCRASAWALLAAGLAACAGDAVTQEPELLTLDSPFAYPVQLWDEGAEGETVIMVRVTDTGGVDSVYVLESSGQPAFDSAAVHGARELRFAPGRRDDRRVTMWARLPVRFHMNGDAAPPARDPLPLEGTP